MVAVVKIFLGFLAVCAGLVGFSPAHADGAHQDFRCENLDAAFYKKLGLAQVTRIKALPGGVCQANLHGNPIVVSAQDSPKTEIIARQSEFAETKRIIRGFEVAPVKTGSGSCSRMILNDPQIIQVTADKCSVAARIVSGIVARLSAGQAQRPS